MLHGDDVVFEETTELMKYDASNDFVREYWARHPEAFEKSYHESHKEHELMLTTVDQDRVTRAWQYIYSHGCIGKKSQHSGSLAIFAAIRRASGEGDGGRLRRLRHQASRNLSMSLFWRPS
jgi:hypothetical protein